MDWVQWLIPLVALAVYILSNLAKGQEESRTNRLPRPPRSDEAVETAELAEPPRQRRSQEEIDRFLEEVRRRKKTIEPPQNKPLSRPTTAPSQERPRPVPPPLPKVKLPPPPLPERPRPGDAPRPATKPPSRKREPEPIPVVEALEVTHVPLQPPPALVGPLVNSLALQNLKSLLANRQTMATAILLKEILDVPLSKRPPRKMGP
jgi:hypothetical protein